MPSPTAGVITEILFQEDDVVEVGKVLAMISTDGEMPAKTSAPVAEVSTNGQEEKAAPTPQPVMAAAPVPQPQPVMAGGGSDRFYSPLVKNIAQKENISYQELDTVPGTGLNGRVTKKDILQYVNNRPANGAAVVSPQVNAATNGIAANKVATPKPKPQKVATSSNNGAPIAEGNVEIIEMDRMRKLIAKHMVNSKHTSPHVTCLLYTSPSPRDATLSRMPSSA